MRAPAWLSRAWTQLITAVSSSGGATAAAPSPAAGDAVFAGRGRTLRDPTGPDISEAPPAALRRTPLPAFITQSRGLTAEMNRAAYAAEPRTGGLLHPILPPASADARTRAARAAELRATVQPAAVQPAAAGTVPAAAAGLLPTGEARADALPPGLSQLVAMGFSETASRQALVAAGGDLGVAIEMLAQ
jgi:hypothetical protein